MPKSEREEAVAALTARIFSAMLNDLVMDATLQAHHEVARSREVCRICNTLCGSAHTPGPSTLASQATVPSIPGTPASAVDAKPTNGSAGTGTSTPTSIKDGNLYLECVNCTRQIASNRYAPHLSTCMGLASARRGATRGNAKCKPASDAGRSVSPDSDEGALSANESPNKGKGKGKAAGKRADDAEFNLKRKRTGSPQVSPTKNQKKQKTSGSPMSRLKAGKDTTGPRNNAPSNSQSKVPSKLRDSSTASFLGGSSTSTSSRDSSPGGVSAVTPASSSFSHSPHLANGIKSKANGVGPPKRPSPPRRPPSIHVADYNIDVEGEETGSSTDTDSSS